MRAALAVPRLVRDAGANCRKVIAMIGQAAAQRAELALFPEAVLTGLVNNDDPGHDLPLGQEVLGAMIGRIAAAAAEQKIHVCLGLLERDGERLYDSALLIDDRGSTALHYRRISLGWHGFKPHAATHSYGVSVPHADTRFGRVVTLICGDLFDDDIMAAARAARPDLLLFPFARSFDDGSIDQQRWDSDEIPDYAGRVGLLGASALMVNYLGTPALGDHSFGGAMVVSGDGRLLAHLPLGREGLLVAEV